MIIERFDDIWYSVIVKPSSHHVDYNIHKHTGQMPDKDGDVIIPLYGMNYKEEIDEGDFDIGGYVKWDGCSNWSTNPDCMFHGCSREDISVIGDILSKCWDLTAKYCRVWDYPSLYDDFWQSTDKAPWETWR